MTARTQERLGASTGLVFAGLFLASIFLSISGETDTGRGAEVVAEKLLDNEARVLAGGFARVLAGLALIWFGGSMRTELRRAEGAEGRLSAVAFGGAVAAATALFLSGTLTISSIVEYADYQDNAEAALLVWSLGDFVATIAALAGAAVLLAAGSLVALRTGIFGRTIAWMGLVGAVASVVQLWPFFIIGMLLIVIWTAASSIALIRRLGATREAPS